MNFIIICHSSNTVVCYSTEVYYRFQGWKLFLMILLNQKRAGNTNLFKALISKLPGSKPYPIFNLHLKWYKAIYKAIYNIPRNPRFIAEDLASCCRERTFCCVDPRLKSAPWNVGCHSRMEGKNLLKWQGKVTAMGLWSICIFWFK